MRFAHARGTVDKERVIDRVGVRRHLQTHGAGEAVGIALDKVVEGVFRTPRDRVLLGHPRARGIGDLAADAI